MDWTWAHVAVGYALGRTLYAVIVIGLEEVADMLQAKRAVRLAAKLRTARGVPVAPR